VSPCVHLGAIRFVRPSSRSCQPCLASGDSWLHLRMCMTCGQVGCSDDSKNHHALGHYEETDHPIIASHRQPGEGWRWCYVDECYV
jgi:monovalent cation:H+ antiporter-2, CPA2 family